MNPVLNFLLQKVSSLTFYSVLFYTLRAGCRVTSGNDRTGHLTGVTRPSPWRRDRQSVELCGPNANYRARTLAGVDPSMGIGCAELSGGFSFFPSVNVAMTCVRHTSGIYCREFRPDRIGTLFLRDRGKRAEEKKKATEEKRKKKKATEKKWHGKKAIY